jgi:steroid delta-isomerase-like uncharacterized protein
MSNGMNNPGMNNKVSELIFRHLAAENAHDLAATLATLHPECVFEDHATGQIWHGHEGASAHYRQWWRAFDVRVTRGKSQASYWAAEDIYIAEATWEGRHIGDFLGIAPTNASIKQPFVVFVAIQDGLMAGEKFYYDLSSLVAQLGHDSLPQVRSLPFRAV